MFMSNKCIDFNNDLVVLFVSNFMASVLLGLLVYFARLWL